ncbi:SulP family inorganic anion transporter [Pseudaestuariivita atlantica]|uniref:Sulfate:proton symporter n=1 Tax=Pseudaestuariivita atlantica TaxID=1317121 RepID=A0A0L1JJD5_9RHOB|nr:sulfate permease [Pseudaestuariivita atlantica]KNG91880.1 sulfate:proton symporter [Pseudaestuariivita atlantica]
MTAHRLARYLPIFEWLPGYDRKALASDGMAGLIVAIMLVPQGMAYALLAGLPPEVGLYASIVPLVFYGLLGSSRTLAVGPVAIVSLMVATTLGEISETGSVSYLAGAILLAFLSGAILLGMGLARLGFLVNFLSHPVISGFSSAAALVIGLSQLKHLLGFDIPRGHLITDTLAHVMRHISQINPATFGIAIASFMILLAFKSRISPFLRSFGFGPEVSNAIAKAGPLVAVLATTVAVWLFALDQTADVAVVADVPAGLAPLTFPSIDLVLIEQLFPAAALIAIVGFLESVSVAKSLASKRRQKIDANQELIALGAANIGASLTGGYPVSGGFSRSLVNFTAGAVTPMASMITAVLIGITVLALTPLLYYLPKAALAAIILVAVANLIDFKTLRDAWRYNKADAFSLIVTFFSVLVLGVEIGIVVGAALTIVFYLWRTSRPHIAEVGRLGETEHFRNVLRHDVQTDPKILMIRVDESLYFANTAYLEDQLLARIVERPKIDHLILIMSAVNFIDASALDTLETLAERLKNAGVTLHFSEVKGPVMDRLRRVDFFENPDLGSVFLSTHEAMRALSNEAISQVA